jgi:hypothetical protein
MSRPTHSYGPREQFLPFHAREQRWAVLVCHRRAGKTVAAVNDLIAHALFTEKKHARFAYIAPLYSQAKSIAWDYLLQFTATLRTYVNVSELTVELFNGSRIRLYGGDNPDALRGIYLDGVVLDEPAQMKPRLWTEILLPLLADRKGFAVFIGTPAGKNSFYDTVQYAKAHPAEWYCLELRASTSGILDTAELQRLKEQMDEDEFEQEFECSFDAAIKGSYYGKVLNEMGVQGRLLDIPVDPTKPVHAALDLGFRDDSSGWLWQTQPDGPDFIAAFSVAGFAIPDIHALLLEKGFNGTLWLPHDAMAKSLQTGRSVVEQFVSFGHRPKLLPRLGVQDGIQATRQLLGHKGTRISLEGCREGVEALRQYQRDFNDKTGTFTQSPKHDWASHYADGMRYAACAIRPPAAPRVVPTLPAPPKAVEIPQMTLDGLWDSNRHTPSYERI